MSLLLLQTHKAWRFLWMNYIWHVVLTSGPSHLKLPLLSPEIRHLDGLMTNQPVLTHNWFHTFGIFLIWQLGWRGWQLRECCDFTVAAKTLAQSEERKIKTNTIWYHLYVESKIWHRWTYPQNRNRLTDMKSRLVFAKEEGGGREWDGLGIWG